KTRIATPARALKNLIVSSMRKISFVVQSGPRAASWPPLMGRPLGQSYIGSSRGSPLQNHSCGIGISLRRTFVPVQENAERRFYPIEPWFRDDSPRLPSRPSTGAAVSGEVENQRVERRVARERPAAEGYQRHQHQGKYPGESSMVHRKGRFCTSGP